MTTYHNSNDANKRVCALCNQPIRPGEKVNWHHPMPRSAKGQLIIECHEHCHRLEHQTPRANGLSDFQLWGKLGGEQAALTKRWAHNLKHVSTDPYYQPQRDFYIANYSH